MYALAADWDTTVVYKGGQDDRSHVPRGFWILVNESSGSYRQQRSSCRRHKDPSVKSCFVSRPLVEMSAFDF